MEQLRKQQIQALGCYFGRIVELYADWAKQEGLSYNKLAVIMTIFYGEKATQREICSE